MKVRIGRKKANKSGAALFRKSADQQQSSVTYYSLATSITIEVLMTIIKTTDDCQLAARNSAYLCCHKTMFRFSVILVLLVAFTAQSFQRSFIMLQYYSNTASFAEKCENKDRPQMQCHGKCQMVKKIAAAEKQQQQAPDKNLNNKVETLTSVSYFCTAPSVNSATISASFPPYSCGALLDLAYPVLHPPA